MHCERERTRHELSVTAKRLNAEYVQSGREDDETNCSICRLMEVNGKNRKKSIAPNASPVRLPCNGYTRGRCDVRQCISNNQLPVGTTRDDFVT